MQDNPVCVAVSDASQNIMTSTTSSVIQDGPEFDGDRDVDLEFTVEVAESRLLDPKVAFNIGWDFYAHGMKIPSHMHQHQRERLYIGYNEAKRSRVRQSPFDEYTKKWLQTRINAWRRDYHFSEDITVDTIRKIDVRYCPVTKMRLTKGLGLGSDWSIDRVNNDAAYSIGNIIVVSRLANSAKADLTLEQLSAIYHGKLPIPPGYKDDRPLTMQEWTRWHSIAGGFLIHGENDEGQYGKILISLAVTYPPYFIPTTAYQVIQFEIADSAASASRTTKYKQVIALMSKELRVGIEDIFQRARKVAKAIRHYNGAPIEIWHDRALFSRYAKLMSSISPAEYTRLDATISALYRGIALNTSEWQESNGGYTVRPKFVKKTTVMEEAKEEQTQSM